MSLFLFTNVSYAYSESELTLTIQAGARRARRTGSASTRCGGRLGHGAGVFAGSTDICWLSVVGRGSGGGGI